MVLNMKNIGLNFIEHGEIRVHGEKHVDFPCQNWWSSHFWWSNCDQFLHRLTFRCKARALHRSFPSSVDVSRAALCSARQGFVRSFLGFNGDDHGRPKRISWGYIYIYMISIHKFTIAVLIFSDSPFWFVQKLVHISRSNLWIARPSPAKKGLESYGRAGFGGRVLAFSLPRSKSAAAWCDPRRGSSHDSECGDKF